MRKRGLFAAVIAGVAMGPAAVARAEFPELAGTTVVEGSGPAFVDVRIPKSVDFFEAFKLDPEVVTEATYVRVEMRRILDVPSPFGPLRMYFSFIVPRGRAGEGGGATTTTERTVVPAGLYRLYLHTDGPARVTLRFPGLEGARAFHPRRPAKGTESRVLDPRAPMPPGVSAFGGSGDLVSPFGDMLYYAVFGGVEDALPDRSEHCLYVGGDESAAAPYAPGCPQGVGITATVMPENPNDWTVIASYHGFGPGRYGIGSNFTHPVRARTPKFGFAAWTSFDDEELPQEEHAPVVEEIATPPPAPAAAPPPPPAVARLVSARYAKRSRRARLRIACAAGANACPGVVVLGRSPAREFSVPAGMERTLSIRVDRALARRLRRGRGRVTAPVALLAGGAEQRFRVVLRR